MGSSSEQNTSMCDRRSDYRNAQALTLSKTNRHSVSRQCEHCRRAALSVAIWFTNQCQTAPLSRFLTPFNSIAAAAAMIQPFAIISPSAHVLGAQLLHTLLGIVSSLNHHALGSSFLRILLTCIMGMVRQRQILPCWLPHRVAFISGGR